MGAPSSALLLETLDGQQHSILFVFLAAFFFNGLGPYLGYKTVFSFAMFSNLRLGPWGHLLIPASWRLFRRTQYMEVTSIQGLPSLQEVQGKRAAELAVFVLSQPREYYYSRYFFGEALRVLNAAVSPAAPVFVAYVKRGKHCEMPGYDAAGLGFCLPITRYPFVMPRNPDARHSEQGSLVPTPEQRQLF